jgi:hypothetical protein
MPDHSQTHVIAKYQDPYLPQKVNAAADRHVRPGARPGTGHCTLPSPIATLRASVSSAHHLGRRPLEPRLPVTLAQATRFDCDISSVERPTHVLKASSAPAMCCWDPAGTSHIAEMAAQTTGRTGANG